MFISSGTKSQRFEITRWERQKPETILEKSSKESKDFMSVKQGPLGTKNVKIKREEDGIHDRIIDIV